MSTISYTFFLKQPSSKDESLILFSCYFKREEKKFVYSTGEKIKPKNWDKKNRQPNTSGPNRSHKRSAIKTQLDRYSTKFEEIQSRCKKIGEDFTSKLLREEFEKEFKKAKSGINLFFKAYSLFMEQNIKAQVWGLNTIKRYRNLLNILKDYEAHTGDKLTFKGITTAFHVNFKDYSIRTRGHATNTFRRNLGLFKTFMFWALENGYTYQDDFRKFQKDKERFTSKIALKAEDLSKIMAHEFKVERLERARDVFVFACSTGMRFGELKLIGKHNIEDDNIVLKEEKSSTKPTRKIPLNPLSRAILKKYDCELPLIANQKQNAYLKEIFKAVGYDQMKERIVVRGQTTEREKVPMYELISTHTARRTFITMMKRKHVSDKLIAKITGHSDLKTLNQYYQVDDESKKEAVNDVFGGILNPLKVAN